jgi:hypothetical protein
MSGTASKTRDELLVTPIGELEGCWLGLRCSGCTKSVYAPLKLWASRHGRRRRLGDVLAHLRCDHCKALPASAWLLDHPIEGGTHGGQAATWRVDLAP